MPPVEVFQTDPYSLVLINDGEEINPDDSNDGYRFIVARLCDSMFEKLTPGPADTRTTDPDIEAENGTDTSTSWCYALSVGGAMPIQGSADNKIKLTPGTVFQKLGATDGAAATFIPFTFDGTNEITIANGGGVNPRVDLVQMKLEWIEDDNASRDFEDAVTGAPTSQVTNTKWRVQATLLVKEGAAAATPTFPTPDAGYVPICAVRVPAAYAGGAPFVNFDVTTDAVLYDLRMPLSVTPYRVQAKDGFYDAAVWVPQNLGSSLKCNTSVDAAGSRLRITCPPIRGRLLGVAIQAQKGNTDTLLVSSGVGTALVQFQYADLSDLVSTNAAWQYILGGLDYVERESPGGSAPVVDNGTHAPALWCNGYRAHSHEFEDAAGDALNLNDVAVYFKPHNTEEIAVVTFYVAEGL